MDLIISPSKLPWNFGDPRWDNNWVVRSHRINFVSVNSLLIQDNGLLCSTMRHRQIPCVSIDHRGKLVRVSFDLFCGAILIVFLFLFHILLSWQQHLLSLFITQLAFFHLFINFRWPGRGRQCWNPIWILLQIIWKARSYLALSLWGCPLTIWR